ncbi:hypothetical protein B0H11DRAFT_2202625 [Mycena galericulata]|nr:hypothetical protein B0H11DRAFT_2202625 [Mycena galericulata]
MLPPTSTWIWASLALLLLPNVFAEKLSLVQCLKEWRFRRLHNDCNPQPRFHQRRDFASLHSGPASLNSGISQRIYWSLGSAEVNTVLYDPWLTKESIIVLSGVNPEHSEKELVPDFEGLGTREIVQPLLGEESHAPPEVATNELRYMLE